MSMQRYTAILRDPKTCQYLALISLILFGIDPQGFRGDIPVWAMIVIFPIGIAQYLAVEGAILALFAIISLKVPQLRLYTPIINGLSFFSALVIAEWAVFYLSGGANLPNVFDNFLFLFIAAVTMEMIFIHFILPVTTVGRKVPPSDDQNTTERVEIAAPANSLGFVAVGSRHLRLSHIRYMASEEHYVRIVTPHEDITQRAKLAGLVAQTTDYDGIQPHRSYWVSRHAEPKIIKTSGKMALKLSDETIIPIARSRQKEVQHWFDANVDW